MRGSLEAARQRIFPLAGRPVASANLHLTVAFLGAVPADRVPALQLLSEPVEPWRIDLDSLELWWRQRVLVARASQPPQVFARQADALWQRLERLGFKRDPRPFRPHVTLVRDIGSLPARPPWTPVTWRCEQLQLVESRQTSTGPSYAPLGR
jgi:2'-5' RNA ligase